MGDRGDNRAHLLLLVAIFALSANRALSGIAVDDGFGFDFELPVSDSGHFDYVDEDVTDEENAWMKDEGFLRHLLGTEDQEGQEQTSVGRSILQSKAASDLLTRDIDVKRLRKLRPILGLTSKKALSAAQKRDKMVLRYYARSQRRSGVLTKSGGDKAVENIARALKRGKMSEKEGVSLADDLIKKQEDAVMGALVPLEKIRGVGKPKKVLKTNKGAADAKYKQTSQKRSLGATLATKVKGLLRRLAKREKSYQALQVNEKALIEDYLDKLNEAYKKEVEEETKRQEEEDAERERLKKLAAKEDA